MTVLEWQAARTKTFLAFEEVLESLAIYLLMQTQTALSVAISAQIKLIFVR